jgi:hypothetical protein
VLLSNRQLIEIVQKWGVANWIAALTIEVSKVRIAAVGGIPFYAICNFVKWQFRALLRH